MSSMPRIGLVPNSEAHQEQETETRDGNGDQIAVGVVGRLRQIPAQAG